MQLDIRNFMAAPGRRYPIDFEMHPSPEQSADSDWTVRSIRIIGEAFAQLATLYLEADIHAEIVQLCRRCLAPVDIAVVVEEPFELPIAPGSDTVDPLPLALQLVQTAHDPHVVCDRACKGLCSTCGANLNDEPDHVCQTEDPDRKSLRDYLT